MAYVAYLGCFVPFFILRHILKQAIGRPFAAVNHTRQHCIAIGHSLNADILTGNEFRAITFGTSRRFFLIYQLRKMQSICCYAVKHNHIGRGDIVIFHTISIFDIATAAANQRNNDFRFALNSGDNQLHQRRCFFLDRSIRILVRHLYQQHFRVDNLNFRRFKVYAGIDDVLTAAPTKDAAAALVF